MTEEERKRNREAWEELKRDVRDKQECIREMMAIIERQERLTKDQRQIMREQMELIKRIFRLVRQTDSMKREAWLDKLDCWMRDVEANYYMEGPRIPGRIQ